MLAFTPFLIAVAVVAVCALIGWLRWLRFNLDVYDRVQSVEAFDHTPQVARSFLQSLRPRAAGPGRPAESDQQKLEPGAPRGAPGDPAE